MEWRCTRCGEAHEAADPPCLACGHDEFERAADGGGEPGRPRGTVWVCPECGRQHQKHSPPCSRCGNLALEQRDVSDLEDPLAEIGTRWRDVVEPRYVVGYLAVGALLVVLALGALGVVDLPGFGEPAVPDAPGEAETAGNLSLDAVEREFVFALNERRRNASATALSTDATLSRMAAYYDKSVVRAAFGDGDGPSRDALERFDPPCSSRPAIVFRGEPTDEGATGLVAAAGSESDLAASLLSALERGGGLDELLRPDAERVGVDVHVDPTNRASVAVAVC